MRWGVMIPVALLAVVFDASLGRVLALGTVTPSLVAILATFVALHAPRHLVPWVAYGLGLTVDLLTDLPHGPDRVGPLLGPHALGFTFGAILVVQVRALLYKRQLHLVAVMSFFFLLASSLVVVFVYGLHSFYERTPLFWSGAGPTSELGRRLLAATYTALAGLLVGPVLVLSQRAWGFRHVQPRAVTRRM